MRRWSRASLAAAAAAVVVGVIYAVWPGAMLVPIAFVSRLVTAGANPWLKAIEAEIVDYSVHFRGRIDIDMRLVDGSALPEVEGRWRQGGMPYATMTAVAAAVFLACALRAGLAWRRLLARFPLFLGTVYIVGGLALSVAVQRSALEGIGSQLLPRFSFADTAANKKQFVRLKKAFTALSWADSALNGGGRLFLAVICGFVWALPSRAQPTALPPATHQED